MVGCCTHNQSMVLDEYRMIRKDRQGRRREAVTLSAKELFHCVDLQYETGSEPLALPHREGTLGMLKWDLLPFSLETRWLSWAPFSFTAAPQGIMPGNPWISPHFLPQSLKSHLPAFLWTPASSISWLLQEGLCWVTRAATSSSLLVSRSSGWQREG